jgi:hypothetical protein
MISFLHFRLVNAYSINPEIILFSSRGKVYSWEGGANAFIKKGRITRTRKSSAGTSLVEEIPKVVSHLEGLAIYRD